MKSIKNVAFAAMVALGAFTAVTYTSCTKDECADVVCNNGGTCSSGLCQCPIGYEGSTCQTVSIYGTWKGADVCGSATYPNITIKLDPSSTDSSKVLVNNPGGFGTAVNLSGNLSSDKRTITIPLQAVSANVNYQGSINLVTKNTFTTSYTATDNTGTVTCTGSYQKQ